MRAGTRRRVALLLRTIGATAVIGAVVGGANGSGFRDAPLLGALLGALGGATNGVILMGAILGAEILLPPTRLGHALERVPFLVTFAMKFLVYGTLIVLVVGGRPGGRLVRPVAAALLSPDLAEAMYARETSGASSSSRATRSSGLRIWEASRSTTSAFSDCVAAPPRCTSTRSRPRPRM